MQNKYLICFQIFVEEFFTQCNLKHIGKDGTYICIERSAALIAYDHDRVFFLCSAAWFIHISVKNIFMNFAPQMKMGKRKADKS